MGKFYNSVKRTKEEEEKEKKKNSGVGTDNVTHNRGGFYQSTLESKIGLDTLESDLHTMGETLNNIYGSWQTKETMDNTFESVNKVYNKLVGYQDYYTQYGKESGLPDLSELLNTYKEAVEGWGGRTELYGNYQNADAFNKAVKDYQLSEKFKGLSYDRVQGLLRKYDVGSDEYNYLKNYTGYTSAEDFDKAIAAKNNDFNLLYGGAVEKLEEYDDKEWSNTEVDYVSASEYQPRQGGGRQSARVRSNKAKYLKELGFDSEKEFYAYVDSHNKSIEDLGKAKNVYELDNGTVDKYKYLEQNEDFAEHSQYDSSVNEGKKPHYQPFTNYDIKYDYINNVPEIRDSYERKAGNKDAGTAFSDNGWEYLTEKELAYYNYLHYLDGQNGTKKSDKFLEDLKPALQKRYSEKASERRAEMLKNPFTATAFSLASPIMTIAGGIGNLIATGKDIVTGSEYNPYDPLREISNANAHGREVVSQNIAEATDGFELFGQNIASFLYNTGESVLDTVVGGSAFGHGYTVLMGTNAYQQKAKELTEQGYDATTVQGLAITSGVLEMAFEYAGFDHLMKLKDADSIGKVIYNALVSQGGAEGMEELGTSIGNIIAEYGFLGEDSKYMKQYNDLIARGFSEKEASTEVAMAMASEIGWSFAGGWLSGVGLGAGTSVGQYTQNKAVGKDIRGAERIGDVLNIASMTPHESEAYEAYTRYAKKGVTADNITDAQLGNLYNTMSSDVEGGFRTANIDLARAKKTIEKQEGIIESKTFFGEKKAQNKLDKAVSEYTDAQARMGKYAPIADKISGVEESVGAYNVKRAVEKAATEKRAKHEAEVKKLSSGVETSVMADTDKAIEIKGMKDSDTLITSDGEVKLKDVELSDRDADLVAYARHMETSEASLYLEQYNGEENIEEYTNTFSLITTMAKNNYSEDALLKAKGSLSTEQFNAIYAATVTEKYKEKQRNIDKLNADMAGKMSYKGVINDSVINYGNEAVKGKVKWSDLNSRQREAVTFISGFAKATGMNLKLIANDKKKNGSYDPRTNTITIDVYAGIDKAKNLLKDTIIPTMSHETTHWMKEKSPELYRKIGDLIFKTLEAHDGISEVDRVASEVARHNAKGRNITDDGARDEIIARACEDMLKMSEEGKRLFNSLSESEKKTFIDKVKEILADLMEWVDNLLSSYSSDRYEAKVMREYKDTLAELSKMWDEMLVSSVKNNSSMELAGVFGHLTNGVSEDGTTIVGEKALQMSDRTYREGGRDFLVNWLEGQEGISEEDKQNIIEQTDRIAELMRAVAEDNELPDYSAWADMEVVKDENGEKLLSVIVKNGDYAMNIDFSQVCKKRVALNAVLNAMVQSGDLNVHTLTETDVAELNAIIKEHDFEIACALCFVDSKRYRVGAWAESFCDGSDEKVKGKGMVHKYGFNEMVRSLIPKGSKLKVDEFNFTGRDIAGQPTQNLVSEADDSELDFTLIDKIMSENDVKSAQHRYARAIKEHPEIRKILNKAEIISSIGLDAIRLEAPELYKIVNGHQGTAKPKFSHDVVAYGNDILKASNFTAEKAKMVGGVRCQSFSDFMANMVVDYAQFISELSAKGLTSHSYTKEPLFVKLFGLTGMKINMSLVPKAIDMTTEQQKQFAILKDKNANKRSKAYKEALAEYNKLAENAGLDENGNYIWEDETFPYDIAMEIVVDPRYSANCGTIAVGISNKHILKLLADDRISMVIPYHKSGLNHEVAMMRDIALYNDYTKVQSTRFGYYKSLFGGNVGKKLDGVPDFDFYGDLYGVDGKEGTHDPKTTAQNYLNWCDRHNYIPKFDEFRGNPNYYKLLIDFRVYDVDGTYREQQPVKANYPSNAEFKDLILNGVVDKNGKVYGGLKQQQQTSDKLSAETQQIVDEYRQRLTEKYGEDVLVQNSDRDEDYMDAVNNGDMKTVQKLVEEAAKKAGHTVKVYHGTPRFGFTKLNTKKSDDRISVFATSSLDLAKTYSGVENERQINTATKKDVYTEEDVNRVEKAIEAFVEKANSYAQAEVANLNDAPFRKYLKQVKNSKNETAYKVKKMSELESDMELFIEPILSDVVLTLARKGDSNKNSKNDELRKLSDKILNELTTSFAGNYGFYANVDNLYEIDGNGAHWSTIPFDKIPGQDTAMTREIAAWAKKNGYAGVWFKNINDPGGRTDSPGATDVYAFFNPKTQLKSADPVTYDNKGNVIPLSKRFNDKKDDIRYSDRDEDLSVFEEMGEAYRIEEEIEWLKEDIKWLNERVKLEGQVTNGKYFKDSSINAAAEVLLKKAESKYDKVRLMRSLRDLYHYIGKTDADVDVLQQKSYDIAMQMLSETKPKVVKNDYYAEVLNRVKKTRVRFNKNQKAESKARFGGNWNRSFFGKIIIADDAILELDQQWQEWAEEYPDIFDVHVNDADQPMELYDILTTLKEQSETVDEYNKEEAAMWLVKEIINQYWNLSPLVTTADKYSKQIKELTSKHRQKMKEARDDYNARVEEAKLAERMFYGKKMSEMRKEYDAKLEKQRKTDSARMADKLAETREQHEAELYEKELAERMHFGAEIAKLRRQKDEKVAEAKEHGKQKMAEYKESVAKKTKIQSITRNALDLVEKRVDNSKDKHIPEIMLGPVDALLDAINFSSKRLLDGGEPTKTDISLAKSLSKIKDMMAKANSKAADELIELYGHGLDESIEKMVENVDRIVDTIGDNEFVLNRMSLEDLQTLDNVVKTIKQAVNKLNKFHVVNHAKGIANLSQESMVYLDSLGKAKVYDGMRGKISKLLNWNNTLPYYAFKRYGEGGMAVYTAFQDGWDKFAFNVKSVMDYAKDAYTNDEVKAWSKEVKEFKILVPAKASDLADDDYTPEYQTVRMTVPQIMSMYCLNKREQARGHLFKGGIRVADFKDSKGKIVSQSDGVVFTEKDVSTIFDSLTDRQKAVADKLQEFMNTVCTDWGNEVSMARFGYKAFGEANYFPIQSDKNNLAVDDETKQQNSLFRLLNMSFTKSVDDKANNRIVISDIFDVFAQHSSDMAKYNALALPVLDAFKWYNYKEKQDVADGTFKTKGVKQSIETAFGKNGQSYFTTFLKDINGQKEVSGDTLGSEFFTNVKIAAVGANLRVVALQPTSYVRASTVIDSRYLTRAFAHKPKIDKAEKWCGIALWKSMGYYDTNIQRGVVSQIKHDETGLDKAKEKSMKLAEMADKITWGYLWNACELEIRDKRKDLEVGSDEFYTEIGKRLREVIYATQVVDSTMTRSQMMRSSQFYDKMLTAFASEPTLSYNMLQDAYMGYSLDARRMGKAEAFKKNGKRIARTLVAYTMTNALAALVESGFDVYREDDDEEEMDLATFMKYYLTNFLSDMSITAKIPYIKEAHSVIKGFGSSRTDTQWMDSMVNAGKAWAKTFSGEGSAKSTIKYTLKAFSDVSGLPFYNVYRESAAFLDKTEIFTSDDLNEMFEDIFN